MRVEGACLHCTHPVDLVQSWLHRCIVTKTCSCGDVFESYEEANTDICQWCYMVKERAEDAS